MVTPAIYRETRIRSRLGPGVAYVKGRVPALIIHLDGGEYDDDSDAFLRLDEAAALRDALSWAIDAAAEAFTHFTEWVKR